MKINTNKIYNKALSSGIALLALSITFSITFMNIAFGLLALAFFIKLFKKEIEYISTGLEIPIIIFLGFYLLSALFSGDIQKSVKAVIDNYWYILHLYLIVYLFGEKEVRNFIKILGWSAFAIAIFTILQSLAGLNFTLNFSINSSFKFSPPTLEKFTQIKGIPIYYGTGIIGQHIKSAGQILMLFFITYAAFKKKWASVAVFFAAILSFSYSVWLGLLIALLWYMTVRKKKFLTAGICLAILFLGIIYIPGAKNKIKENISQKVENTRGNLKVFSKHPLLGIGPGRYSQIKENGHNPPQSVYCNIILESGMLTFLAFLYLIFMLIKNYLKRDPSLKERWRELHLASWLALLAVFIAGCCNNFLDYAENSVLIWTLVGIIIKIKKSRWTHRLVISKKRN